MIHVKYCPAFKPQLLAAPPIVSHTQSLITLTVGQSSQSNPSQQSIKSTINAKVASNAFLLLDSALAPALLASVPLLFLLQANTQVRPQGGAGLVAHITALCWRRF
jgi:hypothetical protein